MIVISDTTPLISLMKASRLTVLQDLYGEVLIPEAVLSELITNSIYSDESKEILECPFVRVVSVSERSFVDILQRATGLDLGESEAIIYADEHKADLLLMDEMAGRRVARSMGLELTGTIGILLEAYDEGFLTAEDIENALDQLKMAKRWISKDLLQYASEYVRR